MQVVLDNEPVVVNARHYSNGRIALIGTSPTGQPWATFTINVPEEDLAPDETIIKTYSEGEMFHYLEVLQAAGIVGEPIRPVHTGWVTIPVVKLLLSEEEINQN